MPGADSGQPRGSNGGRFARAGGRAGVVALIAAAVGVLGLSFAAPNTLTPATDRPVAAPNAPAQPPAGTTLDLNAATPAQLELLPGVGPALAARIIAHRAEHGPFPTVDALTDVKGIGPKTLERLRPYVRAGSAPAPRPPGPHTDAPPPQPAEPIAPAPAPVSPRALVDINAATADELTALPGIGPALGARIVQDRAERGPFSTLDDLARVPGIGPKTVERLRAHATVGGAPSPATPLVPTTPTPWPAAAPPIDLNAADAAALETLPGIGPALAARILEHRAEHGPFASVDALTGVKGIGPKTLERLRPRITVTGASPTPAAPVRAPTPTPTPGPIDLRATPVNINAASAEALEALPGIGPALAGRIVAHRAARGPFRRVEDLKLVSGIGSATSARLAPLIWFGPPDGPAYRPTTSAPARR